MIEHPVHAEGVVHDDGKFKIEAAFLDHGVDNVGWRITEPDTRKFDPHALKLRGIQGDSVRKLIEHGELTIDGQRILIDDVSWIRKGDSVAVVIDTRVCPNAVKLAQNAKLFLCESTYQDEHQELAYDHYHMTSKQAATIAKQANAKKLILTHFSARYQNTDIIESEAKSIFPNSFVADDFKVFPFEK